MSKPIFIASTEISFPDRLKKKKKIKGFLKKEARRKKFIFHLGKTKTARTPPTPQFPRASHEACSKRGRSHVLNLFSQLVL